MNNDIHWARGERGYCRKCGQRVPFIQSGVLRKHLRLVESGERYMCEGSHEKGVRRKDAPQVAGSGDGFFKRWNAELYAMLGVRTQGDALVKIRELLSPREEPVSTNAVDPSAASTGKRSTRD